MSIVPAQVKQLRDTAHLVITHGLIIAHRNPPDDTEYWHNIGEGGQPTFQNDWQNYNAGTNPCGYRRDSSGFVHLRGMVKGIPAQGTGGYSVIFTLAASWRPAAVQVFPIRFQENQVGELDSLYVRSNGEVALRWPLAGPFVRNALWLDNYRWKAVA